MCLLQLDVMDPGTVLMWIFGSILVLLWLLFLFYGEGRQEAAHWQQSSSR
jgi:hypothetical protein